MTVGAASSLPDLDARLRGFAIDQALVVAAAGSTAAAAWLLGSGAAGWFAVGAALLVTGALGACDGATGRTPGRMAAGTVLLDHDTGRPVGVVRGMLRTSCLTALGLPTAGTAWLVLALSALSDPRHGRRGWHDRALGTQVASTTVDGPASTVKSEAAADESGAVNLMALRLAPPGAGDVVPVPRAGEPRVLPRAWCVEFDRGETYDVDHRLLVGRCPATGDPDEPGWARVASADGSVSATHAELAALPDGSLVLRDRGSRNGTLLVRGAAARTLPPGRPTTLLPGDRVRLGDRWMRVRGRDGGDARVEPNGSAPAQVLPLP